MLWKWGRLWCELAANEQACRKRRKSHHFYPNHRTALTCSGVSKIAPSHTRIDQPPAPPVLTRSQPTLSLTDNMLAIVSVAQMALAVERQEVEQKNKKSFLWKKISYLLYCISLLAFLVSLLLTRRFSEFKMNWFYYTGTICQVFGFRVLYFPNIHSLAFLPIRLLLKPNIQ